MRPAIVGRGLLVGCEFNDPSRGADLNLRAVDEGVIVNVAAGRVIRFFPALNIPEDELFGAVDTVLALAAA